MFRRAGDAELLVFANDGYINRSEGKALVCVER
jgi:hypothetical protein